MPSCSFISLSKSFFFFVLSVLPYFNELNIFLFI
jgi:hypothetical protein